MRTTIRFLLNGAVVQSEEENDALLIDWLRRNRGLTGTKEGCREGDCGACLVLLGGGRSPAVEWTPVASCLLALGELDGRGVVTIEGLASAGPTPVMLALHGENASQCGFCSPGIVVALTGRLLSGGRVDEAALAAALEGNLCRCTGYASIRRAARRLGEEFSDLPDDPATRLAALAVRGVVPPALAATMTSLPEAAGKSRRGALLLGGGTDWFVRHTDAGPGTEAEFSDRDTSLQTIARSGSSLRIGGAVTVRDFFASQEVRSIAPGIEEYEDLFASPPIRARATLAGNIANASPVADATALLLALGGRLLLRGEKGAERELPLEDFFLGYKRTALAGDERIEAILLPEAEKPRRLHFEKAGRRARLDIATVNTAFACYAEGGTGRGAVLTGVRLTAGGVAPTPLLLRDVSSYLEGRSPTAEVVREAAQRARSGTNPISDARGSGAYRSDLVERLVTAHFLALFPEAHLEEVLFP